MSKIKSFDRSAVRLVREDLDAAIQTVAKKHGVSVIVGNASFTADNVNFKVQVAVLGDSGTAVTREVSDFKEYASLLGLTPDDLGRTFLFRDQPYEIVGARMSSHKYPILGKKRNGKVYKFTTVDVRKALGKPVTEEP